MLEMMSLKQVEHTPIVRKIPEVKCGYCGGVEMPYITPEYQKPITDFAITIGTEEYQLGKLHGDCSWKVVNQIKDFLKKKMNNEVALNQ